MKHRVSARSLAEFATERGDLFPAIRSIDLMQDGMAGHKLWQSRYPEGFEREVALKISQSFGDVELTVYGRADGLCRGCVPPVVEEIKTTRLDPHAVDPGEHPEHWAQAEIYAHILAIEEDRASVEVRLTYLHLSGEACTHTRTPSAGELAERFTGYAAPYAAWLAALDAWKEEALPTARALTFPYEGYRDGQREMAAAAYRAFRARRSILVQAPTGIGKTAAALFAALKAMGEGLTSRIFYLTARTTTRLAAEQALDRMRATGLRVRSITLTAKEKLCPCPGTVCDPSVCPRAAGHYDRSREALRSALAIERLSRDQVEALADAADLCPFEFQLDLSETCDVVICDYNYAFDPRVKLKRFFLEKSDSVLLVDEAHNLIDRAREMLSAASCEGDWRALRRALKRQGGEHTELYAALTALIEAFKGLRLSYDHPCWADEQSEALNERMEIFLDAARPLLGGAGAFAQSLTERYFEALNYTRVSADMGATHRVLYEPSERDLSVKLWCLSPAPYLRKCFDRVRGALLFSATLTPMRYYRDMLGIDEEAGDGLLDLPSPFPSEHLCVVALPIGTTFRRRESTAGAVAEAIAAMARAKTGNYLVGFPSHAYLNLVGDALSCAARDLHVVRQLPRMSEREREAFIRGFVPNPARSMVALVAMGGVFSEGIDLPGDLLIGAAVVGIGTPQLSLERAALESLMDDGEGTGHHYAYTFPGLVRVLQAAGRVIRTEDDRGVVALIDERFCNEDLQALLPAHWQVHTARDVAAMARILDRFWAD